MIAEESKAADSSDAYKQNVHVSTRILPAVIGTSSLRDHVLKVPHALLLRLDKHNPPGNCPLMSIFAQSDPFLSPSLFPFAVWGGGGVFGPFGHWLPGHRPLPAGHQRFWQRQLSQRAPVVQRSAGRCVTGLHPLQYSRWALWGEAPPTNTVQFSCRTNVCLFYYKCYFLFKWLDWYWLKHNISDSTIT